MAKQTRRLVSSQRRRRSGAGDVEGPAAQTRGGSREAGRSLESGEEGRDEESINSEADELQLGRQRATAAEGETKKRGVGCSDLVVCGGR